MTNFSNTIRTEPIKIAPTNPVRGIKQGENDPAARQAISTGGNLLPDPRNTDPAQERVSAVDEVAKATITLSNLVQSLSRELHFSVDETVDRIVVTVMDATTDQVIRQIPSEEVLSVARALKYGSELDSAGLLIESKA